MIKALGRRAVRKLLIHDALWSAMPAALRNRDYLRVQRTAALQDRFAKACKTAFASGIVQAGPFAGMRYPQPASFGSALYPKLIGSYESELHGALRRFCKRAYDGIVDIGFAEGYYLVGLGGLFPRIHLWGFDTSPQAHSLCRGLAHANGIASARLHLHWSAEPVTLRRPMEGRTLVICDCEGFEVELFAQGNEATWERADLIVECHDFIQPKATASVHHLLERTHDIELVSTIEPGLKKALVGEEIRAIFSEDELLRLVNEGRPCRQDWLVASSRMAARSTSQS